MNIRKDRLSIGAEILKTMNKKDELPLPNSNRLVKVMMEYFETEDYGAELKEMGSKWVPTEDYWRNNLNEIRAILRKEKRFFEFDRKQGEFKGQWKFVSKKEFDRKMKREYAEMGTRTDTFNDKRDDGSNKWPPTVPPLAPVPALPDNHKNN